MQLGSNPIMASAASEISQFQPHAAAQLMPVKLKADNYLLWKSLLVPLLMRYNMLDIVQATEQDPSLRDSDQNCMDFIKLTLSEDMLPQAIGCSTSRALWLKLKAQGGIARTRIFEMTSRLANIKKGRFTSMSTYYQSAKQIADQLAAAGSPIADADFVNHVLKGLPAEFDKFSNSIRARSDTVTSEKLHELLVAEETKRRHRLYRQVIRYGVVGLVCYTVSYVNYRRGDDNGYSRGSKNGFDKGYSQGSRDGWSRGWHQSYAHCKY